MKRLKLTEERKKKSKVERWTGKECKKNVNNN